MQLAIDVSMGVVQNSYYLTAVEQNGITEVVGKEHIVDYLNNMKKFSLNVTIGKVANEFGEFINGSYTGVLKYLQDKEVDTAFMFVSPRVENDAFELSQPLGEFINVIHSYTKPPFSTNYMDVFNSLSAIGPNCWIAVVFFGFLLLLVLKFVKHNVSPIDIYSMFFEQNYIQFEGRHIQVMGLIATIGLAFIFDFITAAFSTNLVVVDYAPKVETFDDILNLNVTPLFFKPFRIHEKFEHAITEEEIKVWRKVKKYKVDEVIMKFDGFLKRPGMISSCMAGNTVLLMPKQIETFAASIQCFFNYGMNASGEKQMYYVSKSFGSQLIQMGLRHNLPYSVNQRLNDFYHVMLESGLSLYFIDNLMLDILKSGGIPFYAHCVNRMLRHAIEWRTEEYVDVPVKCFLLPQLVLLITLSLGFGVLVVESVTKLFFGNKIHVSNLSKK